MSNINLNVRMCFLQFLKTFRCCDDGHKFDLLSTNDQRLSIQILNGQANPVFSIFSNVGNPT